VAPPFRSRETTCGDAAQNGEAKRRPIDPVGGTRRRSQPVVRRCSRNSLRN